MAHDSCFDTEENKTLLAICTRKMISNIGIGGIVWGLINIPLGIFAMRVTFLNAGLVLLGSLMLATGIQALRRPTLGALLSEAIVTGLLFLWNLGITILNVRAGGEFHPHLLIWPIVIAVIFFIYYAKLQHVRDLVASVNPASIQAAKRMCKTLVKKKLKEEPLVVQTSDRKCRAQLQDGRAFFIQRDLRRAFVASVGDVRKAIASLETKTIKMAFSHPLGGLKYAFDKKNSEKWRNWLAPAAAPPAQSGPAAVRAMD